MTVGFTPPGGEHPAPEQSLLNANDAELLRLALVTDAIDVSRVLAHCAARALLHDLRPAPEDVGELAQWLSSGKHARPDEDEDEEDEEEEEEEEGFPEVQGRDWWPPVLLSIVAVAAFFLIAVAPVS